MKVVALVSGGKDSCYAMMKCEQYGHQIVALANLMPIDDAQDELDSFMYQTVGHQIVVSYAQCMGIPLFRRRIQGSTRNHGLSYNMTPGDEVEDMLILLKEVKRQIPSVSAVCSGAIASDYQRLRVENVCSRLGLISLAYLWKLDQSLLLQNMIRSGIVAITVKVAALGLNPSKHLGKEIKHLESHLHKLNELYGVNVCGEGGEYETLTLDCPLFKNARIVLDKFQVVLHSSDEIAPVGVLHPLEFHVEKKLDLVPTGGAVDSVFEVLGDWQDIGEDQCQKISAPSAIAAESNQEIHISKSGNGNIFSIACWLQDADKISSDLVEDLRTVLTKIELVLGEYNSSWENVLYIHLYIADMNEFAMANEAYMKFIRQEKCRFGVPSRSTVELPLLEVSLGRAYVEVLVTNDSSKKVLHVQSVSEWAPSCIGPYSQATLHRDVLYMAGQLGLDPSTMLLCDKGPAAELEQALENSEAVAASFNCSISTSALSLVVYCSMSLNSSDRITIANQMDVCVKRMEQQLDEGRRSKMPVMDGPVTLYILLPDLPKRALLEVKPLLYTRKTIAPEAEITRHDSYARQAYWGLQDENWHNCCLQKCIINGVICTSVISVTSEVAAKICSQATDPDCKDSQCKVFMEKDFVRIARFCIYLLDRVLEENNFSWSDVLNLRIYFSTSPGISYGALSSIFANVFKEFSEMGSRVDSDKRPQFNLVSVLGAGRSAISMNDILTCELFARKF